jgi:hypothetical protein
MTNVPGLRGKIAAFALLTLVLSVSVFSQASLRRAMDQDNDGKADLMIFRPSNNVWYIKRSGGGLNFQTFGLANSDYMTPGDYDGDGLGDIAVWRDTTGFWYFLRSSNGTIAGVQWGMTGDEPVARNYDADNITDLAVVRRIGGHMIWYVLGSVGSTFRAESWGLSSDFTAPGDYDGDGKFDLAIQRPGATPTSQATFWLNRSGGGIDIFAWGLSNDFVVPGDYDGDGKTDVAVVRQGATPSSGLSWYIRKSSDGNLLGIVFGITSTDIITQNDYDGDGKCDPSVWRDTTGTFWVALSTTNYTLHSANQWGLSGDFPVGAYDTH